MHSQKKRGQTISDVAVGDVVILKNDLTKRLYWKLAIVEELLKGKDGITRAAIVRVANPGG